MTTSPLPTILDPRPILRKYNVRARRAMGQNFLVSGDALHAVLDAADLHPGDRVLEVGPGVGTLTAALVQLVGCVVALELDPQLVEIVRAELAGAPNLAVVQGDALTVDHPPLVAEHCGEGPYKVVANLPYYITSHVLRRLLETEPRPTSIAVMVQAEVAERVVAEPPNMSLLAVSVQYYAEPRASARVPAEAFVPRPEVDSAVLSMTVHPAPLFPEHTAQRYFSIVSAGFGQKRKTLSNSLSSNLKLPKATVVEALLAAHVDPRARAQTLTLDEWAEVCRTLPES